MDCFLYYTKVNYSQCFFIINNSPLIDMQQQYYFHSNLLTSTLRKNIKPIKFQDQPMICMSNDCSIQLYQYAAKGISFRQKFNFFCYISHIQILPDRHHSTDFVFILDKKGRYAFWQSNGGFQLVQNGKLQTQQNNLYRTNNREGQDCTFCGEMHRFEVLDTRGSIFFNQNHEIIVIDYSIKLLGLKIQRTKRINVQLIKFRHLAWIQNNKHQNLLGLIQQKQQKTIFKIFNTDKLSKITHENQLNKLQKINLLQFLSISKNEFLLLSSNQLILLSVHPFEVIARHKIHDTFGKLINLDGQVYGYIGAQLILINKTCMKSYGSFQYKDQNVLKDKQISQARFLRKLQDGGKLISIITKSHDAIFIILYENTWTFCQKISSLSPIFSLHATNNPHCLVAVTNSAINQYSVIVVSQQIAVPIQKQQDYPYPIQRIISLMKGQKMLICSKEANHIIQYNPNTAQYQPSTISIPTLHGQFISTNDYFYITTQTIFTFNGDQLKQLQDDHIVLAQLIDHYVVYLNAQHQVKEIDLNNNSFNILREAAPTQYLWALLSTRDLIAARSDNVAHLFKYKGSELLQTISLNDSTLISGMSQVSLEDNGNRQLVIGFVNGTVKILNEHYQNVKTFQNYSSQVVNFFKITSDKLGIISGSKQFILQKQQQYQMKQLQLSYNYKTIFAIAYSQISQKLIFAQIGEESQSKILKTVSIKNNLNSLHKNSYRMTSICQFKRQIPIIYVNGSTIYIAIKQKLLFYHLGTGKLLKQLNNYFADVIGIEPMTCGTLVYGIDELNRNILMIIQPKSLEVVSTINLILKDSKYIKTIKTIPDSTNNMFICRGEKYTSVYELNDTNEPNQLYQIKADYQGYSLDLDIQHSLLAETDSYRFIAVYSYDEAIVPMARHVALSEVNDMVLLSKAVLFADKAGQLSILEYNVQNPQEALRMLTTKVGSINTGEEVTVLTKLSPKNALYGTFNGKVGRISIISQEQYGQLKTIQQSICLSLSKKCAFSYQKWKSRSPIQDKMIDGNLIQKYLQDHNPNIIEDEAQMLRYEQILSIYKALTK